MSVSAVKWHKRAGKDTEETVYLFKKSYEKMKNVSRRDLLYEKALALCSDNGSVPSYGDPVLSYLFAVTSTRPPVNTIVSYYERDAEKYFNGTSFVDMCCIFNQVELARNFASSRRLDYEILHMTDRALSSPEVRLSDIYQSENAVHWLYVMHDVLDMSFDQKLRAAERVDFVLRFISGQAITAVCALAARGYIWDMFVLMSLLHPSHELTKQLRAMIWEIHNLSWIDDLIAKLPGNSDICGLMDLGLLPSDLHAAIKLSLQCNMENDHVRSTSYGCMRFCLMSIVCNDTDQLRNAFEAANKFWILVKSNSNILSEFLPAVQKSYFEAAFRVMSTLVKTVMFLFGNTANKIRETGIFSTVLKQWAEKEVVPRDEELRKQAKKGICDIISAFIDSVSDFKKIRCHGDNFMPLVLLALRIGQLMFKDTLSDHSVSSIVHIFDKPNEKYQIIVQRFLQEINRISKDLAWYDELITPTSSTLSKVCNALGIDCPSEIDLKLGGTQTENTGAVVDVERSESTLSTTLEDFGRQLGAAKPDLVGAAHLVEASPDEPCSLKHADDTVENSQHNVSEIMDLQSEVNQITVETSQVETSASKGEVCINVNVKVLNSQSKAELATSGEAGTGNELDKLFDESMPSCAAGVPTVSGDTEDLCGGTFTANDLSNPQDDHSVSEKYAVTPVSSDSILATEFKGVTCNTEESHYSDLKGVGPPRTKSGIKPKGTDKWERAQPPGRSKFKGNGQNSHLPKNDVSKPRVLSENTPAQKDNGFVELGSRGDKCENNSPATRGRSGNRNYNVNKPGVGTSWRGRGRQQGGPQ